MVVTTHAGLASRHRRSSGRRTGSPHGEAPWDSAADLRGSRLPVALSARERSGRDAGCSQTRRWRGVTRCGARAFATAFATGPPRYFRGAGRGRVTPESRCTGVALAEPRDFSGFENPGERGRNPSRLRRHGQPGETAWNPSRHSRS